MPVTTTTTVVKEQDIGTAQVHATASVINGTSHKLDLTDLLQGGVIRLNNQTDIIALKQFLIDAGY